MHETDDVEVRLKELDPQERYHLIKLRDRMKNVELSAESVGAVLPEAVFVGEEKQRKLSRSMVEITERAIGNSIRKDPEVLSTALFPIIGATIRRALNQLLIDSMTGVNAGLERTFSWKRMKWRIESARTGVPFIEILIRNTLQFRVEHVFLIHAKTGILLSRLSRSDSKSADSEMVAPMLTVIQEYIKDSLLLTKAESVDGITAGEYSFLVEEGPRAILALVVRGAVDGSLRSAMQEALESVHLRLASELDAFSGDVAPFEGCVKLLQPCFISREKGGKAKPVYAIVLLSLFVAGLLSLGVYSTLRNAGRNAFVESLNREPGMLVASAKMGFRKTRIRLMRDPRARTPVELAAESRVDLADYDLDIEEFVSPALGLGPDSQVRAVPRELLDLARELAALTLLFEQNTENLSAGQEQVIREAGSLIATIVEKAGKMGFAATVEITGHAAGTIQDDESVAISLERARKAMNLFALQNKPLVKYVGTRGVGVAEPVVKNETTEEDRIKNRSVSFKALFR